MADSTRTKPNARRLAAWWLAIAGLTLAIGSGLWRPAPARADGDPASDVLASQSVFLPQDGGLSNQQEAQLAAVVAAAHRAGFPLRVAIVASPTDLGSITELWRQPQNYARFLGQELSLIYHGTLLVVMPAGYGLFGPQASDLGRRSGLAGAGARPGAPGPELGRVTIAAVQRLAAAAGHPVSVGAVSAPTTAAGSDVLAFLALAIGAVLIVVAWVASLRARPLGARGGEPGSVA